VVGRPILESADPRGTVAAYEASLAAAFHQERADA
jgi:orotidine-5'-phosphate decarboxylase